MPPPPAPLPAYDATYFSRDPATVNVGWRQLEQMWEFDENGPARQLGSMRGVNFTNMKVECFVHKQRGQRCGVILRARGARSYDILNDEVFQFFRMAAAYKGADLAAEAAHHQAHAETMRARMYAAVAASLVALVSTYCESFN